MTTQTPPAAPAARHVVSPDRPVRVALVGAGAVARANLMPVLAGHERVTIAAIVDRDEARARELAEAYGVQAVLTDMDALDPAKIDAVVLATPPAHHAPATRALAARGLHVLVEKPMAITTADARAMVEATDEAGVQLAVGLYRRMLPAIQLLRSLIDTQEFGAPVSVDIEEGGPYGWGLATLDVLTKSAGGGGTLIDIGSHLIDVLLYVLPGSPRLARYEDNARGGIETDCVAHVDVDHRGRAVPVRLELSRTRELRGTLVVTCEHATIEVKRANFLELFVTPRRADGTDGRTLVVAADFPGRANYLGYDAFRAQIDDWIGAMTTGADPVISGRSVVPVVELVETCYASRHELAEPWTDEGMTNPTGRAGTQARGRVLVTGAGGFLGGRAVELLRGRYGWDVVALVREPKSAARLARWDTEIVIGDVCSPDDMTRALRGCDAVVHCAVGTGWQADEVRRVTIVGTRTTAEAALRAGVTRFVHISTMFVHKRDGEGVLDEQVPLTPPEQDSYGQNKLRAEQAVQTLAAKGLGAVILRPGKIYGPFSRTFTTRPLQALGQGQLVITGDPTVPSNMVYVDNVVEAIARALDAKTVASGAAYLVVDPDSLTLEDFYGYFAKASGRTLRVVGGPATRPPAPKPGLATRWVRGTKAIALSPELRGLIKRIINTEPIGTWPRKLWDGSPTFQAKALKAFGVDTAVVYRPAKPAGAADLPYYGEPVRASSRKAEAELGYKAEVPRERAMALTLAWARAARLL